MRGASHLTPVWRSLHRRRMTLNAGLSSCSSRPLQEGLNVGWRTEEDDDDARDLHAVAFWRRIHMGRREESRYVASESKISVAMLPTHSTCLNCSPKNVARISTSADCSLSNAATLQEPKLETRPEYEPTERKSPSRVMKPRSLSLDPTSKFRVQDPSPTGFGGAMLKLLGYYSKQSQLIRGANTLYSRISMQVDKPELYANFILEQNFRTTHSMLVLYLWLCLCRVRAEGKDGAAVGQSLYDAFNHDLEKRIIATGLKVLLSKWMKELEKNFYGAVTAYDAAMKPGAAQDELSRALWRNVFAEDDSLMPTGPTAAPVHALARYVRREIACLSLTGENLGTDAEKETGTYLTACEKYIAAFVIVGNGLHMIGLGPGVLNNNALLRVICREVDKSLLLAQLAGWCYWCASLCAGDGFADIVGRKYGTKKPPYNCSKSYIGSLAFASASLVYMGFDWNSSHIFTCTLFDETQ